MVEVSGYRAEWLRKRIGGRLPRETSRLMASARRRPPAEKAERPPQVKTAEKNRFFLSTNALTEKGVLPWVVVERAEDHILLWSVTRA
jgi:hypothetical protein